VRPWPLRRRDSRRNLPPAVARALEREKRRRGTSLNQTVIDLLGQGLGVGVTRPNGLAALAGTWSEEEFRDFEDATADFSEIDRELRRRSPPPPPPTPPHW
jgi:hypothetical protein